MNKAPKIIREGGVEWIYQSIHFSPQIMSYYYVGDYFLDLDINEELKSGQLHERIESAGIDGFMPKLVEELKSVIGEGNYKYDGYEFGEDEVNFYLLIKKSEYIEAMEKIKYWVIIADYEKIVSYDVKKVQSFASVR